MSLIAQLYNANTTILHILCSDCAQCKVVQLQSEEEGVVCAGQGGGNRKGEASRVFPAPPHGTNSKVLGTAHSGVFAPYF